MNDRFDARVSLTGRSSDPRPKNPKREMSLTSRVFPSHLRHRARRRWHQGDQGRQEPHRGDRDRRRQGHLREGHLPGAGEGRRGPHRRGSPRPHGALNRHRRAPLPRDETKPHPPREAPQSFDPSPLPPFFALFAHRFPLSPSSPPCRRAAARRRRRPSKPTDWSGGGFPPARPTARGRDNREKRRPIQGLETASRVATRAS